MEALLNNQQICNTTQLCVNIGGSFGCSCPDGTQLNMQGECVVPILPVTTTLVPASSTPAPPSSTALTAVSSTPQPDLVSTTTSTSETPTTRPANADSNQVAVTLGGLTVNTVSECMIVGSTCSW